MKINSCFFLLYQANHTLPTKVHLLKAMVFPVVMYGCECWAIKKVKVKVRSLSRVQLFTTPWTVAYQTPPSMGFSRQGYWSGVPLPSPMWIYTGPQINRLYDARNFFSKCLIYLTYLVFFWYSVFVLLWDRKPGNNRNNNSWSHWNRFEVLF